MAGFEVIVRPAVFPNIRPAPARSLPPEDDPTKGVATLGGSGGGLVQLSYSYSMSMSRSMQHIQEQERTVDTVRVYQKEQTAGGGETVNKNNYLDVDSVRRITGVDAEGAKRYILFARAQKLINTEILKEGTTIKNGDFVPGVVGDDIRI